MASLHLIQKRKQDDVIPPRKKKFNYPSTIMNEDLEVPHDDLLECEDLTRLPYLYDETVLDCVTARYLDDLVYTWAGPVLIAVNPCKIIKSLYAESYIERILNNTKEGRDHQLPHVYTIAGLSHLRLISQIGSANQAILVSGESGAGKTESARYILKYLTHAEQDAPCTEAHYVQRRILASNPILEAFGNASTIRNHNSSRFGKLIRLQYQANTLKGALTHTYLLEKTRVTNQPVFERNFHIFHQLFCGIKNGLLPQLEPDIGSFGSFRILPNECNSKYNDDLTTFKETLNALNQMDIGVEHLLELFKIVIAIMHLGNIIFEFDTKKDAYTISDDDASQESVVIASRILGIQQIDLIKLLTVKQISVVERDKKTLYHKPCERRDQCEERRDSFMQLLYSWLFSHLVTTINEKTVSASSNWCSYLGILDVYGFETFEENSLEQLCINYANERLQQEFTRRYLAIEQRILLEEGFMNFPQLLTDNSRCVSALDSTISVFSILNEECHLKRALDEKSACERVCNVLQGTGVVASPPSPIKTAGFMVKHYARSVNYTSRGILHKNKDEVPNEIFELLMSSSSSFIIDLVKVNEEKEDSKSESSDTPGRRVRKKTTLSKFKSSLDSLMKVLVLCDLQYVRCVKPNLEGIPGYPDRMFLIDQLQAQGIFETVKISQAGYPVRMLYCDFVKRYSFSLDSYDTFTDKEKSFILTLKLFGDDGSGSPAVDKCRYGKNRIFLAESSLQMLEKLREEHRNEAATCIQKNYRTLLCRREYLLILRRVRTVQMQIRTWFIRRNFCAIRESAIVIQKTVRMWKQRKQFRKIRCAVVAIQKAIRGWRCRVAFKRKLQQTFVPNRSSSRLSLSSAGYGSLMQSCMTDYSISDAETFGALDDFQSLYSNIDLHRRICETEESGLETDTESLSGEGLKSGRTPKSRKGRFFTSNIAEFSDTDFSDEMRTNFVPKGHSSIDLNSRYEYLYASKDKYQMNRLQGRHRSNCGSNNIDSNSYSSAKKNDSTDSPHIRICPKGLDCSRDVDSVRLATLKHLRKAAAIIQHSEPNESLRIHVPLNNLYIHFKKGIISYRQLSKVQIRFHTRRTCLPYSTQLPHLEQPKGLLDAIH